MRVVLASASPRRVELLKRIIEDFEVVPAQVDEDAITGDNPIELATRLAEIKAGAILTTIPDALILGGDTVVALPDEHGFRYLAKPLDGDDAARMLRSLSGKTHFVVTGVALLHRRFRSVFAETTTVTFRDLSDEEIRSYVATGEPMDKAGAYAIQGGAAEFVDRISGSLTNVIGLPVEKLTEELQRARREINPSK